MMTVPLTNNPVWVECVPNFSEGRDPAIIGAIVAAIAASGVHVLDVSSDADHHRTVVTFAGTPDTVLEGAYAGIRAAASLIDLDQHHGVHPRIGAADVVPLVPLRGIGLADCARLAYQLGERVGNTLNLPVYLYEAAATRPERRNLADVRRIGYEGLRGVIHTPAYAPDFGEATVTKAGAVVIGARQPLIAYNLYLANADLTIAKAIAARLRERDGGLPAVKALGLWVDGRAQVSVNLIDFRRTSLFTVISTVRALAAEFGASVTEGELIGLVPQAALIQSALEGLGLAPQVADKILERQLGNYTHDYQELPFE
ncbi:MAG: glutamate formimidoyltransferase [Phototrophicaceae bacterium]|jgi:glutamate formiminotransferase